MPGEQPGRFRRTFIYETAHLGARRPAGTIGSCRIVADCSQAIRWLLMAYAIAGRQSRRRPAALRQRASRRRPGGPCVGRRPGRSLAVLSSSLKNMSSQTDDPVARVRDTVAGWTGVETAPGQYNSVGFHLGRRELGHLHGDGTADLPFSPAAHDELITAHRARPHRYLPDSGWVTASVTSPGDADSVIELFALSYRHATQTAKHRAG